MKLNTVLSLHKH